MVNNGVCLSGKMEKLENDKLYSQHDGFDLLLRLQGISVLRNVVMRDGSVTRVIHKRDCRMRFLDTSLVF
jgi:hypothetical protein